MLIYLDIDGTINLWRLVSTSPDNFQKHQPETGKYIISGACIKYTYNIENIHLPKIFYCVQNTLIGEGKYMQVGCLWLWRSIITGFSWWCLDSLFIRMGHQSIIGHQNTLIHMLMHTVPGGNLSKPLHLLIVTAFEIQPQKKKELFETMLK